MTNRRKKSCFGTVLAVLGLCVSAFWLLNMSAGIFFEIPDNLPLVGNLDEAFFTMVFLASLSYLGIELPFFRGRYVRGAIEDKDERDSRK